MKLLIIQIVIIIACYEGFKKFFIWIRDYRESYHRRLLSLEVDRTNMKAKLYFYNKNIDDKIASALENYDSDLVQDVKDVYDKLDKLDVNMGLLRRAQAISDERINHVYKRLNEVKK